MFFHHMAPSTWSQLRPICEAFGPGFELIVTIHGRKKFTPCFFCVLQALYSHGLKCLSFCQKLNWMIKEKLKFSVCCDLYKFLWPKSAPGHAVHRVCDLHKSLEVVKYVFPMHVQNSILMQMKSNS